MKNTYKNNALLIYISIIALSFCEIFVQFVNININIIDIVVMLLEILIALVNIKLSYVLSIKVFRKLNKEVYYITDVMIFWVILISIIYLVNVSINAICNIPISLIFQQSNINIWIMNIKKYFIYFNDIYSTYSFGSIPDYIYIIKNLVVFFLKTISLTIPLYVIVMKQEYINVKNKDKNNF